MNYSRGGVIAGMMDGLHYSLKQTSGFAAMRFQRGKKLLIVNADDFGVSEKVNDGIIDAHLRGVVTSASLLVNMPASNHAIEIAKRHPRLDVGLHVNCTLGMPLCPPRMIGTIVGSDGRLKRNRSLVISLLMGRVKASHLEAEMRAQIEWFLSRGLALYHIDMHHHLNAMPSVMRLLIKLAGEYGIPAIRNPVEKLSLNCAVLAVRLSAVLSGRKGRKSGILFPDQFAGIAITGKWGESSPALRRLLADLHPGIAELMCHPGYVDHALRGISRLITERQDELGILTSPALRSWIQEAGITLTTYRDIVQRRGSAEGYE